LNQSSNNFWPTVDVQTLKFKAIVLVRSFSTPLVRQPKELVISSSDEFENVDLARDDVLFNIVTADTALKRNDGDTFWRGPKEKAVSLLQLLIYGLCPPGGIVCDLSAGTGMSVQIQHVLMFTYFIHLRLILLFAFS
jgi:hypothetical protein